MRGPSELDDEPGASDTLKLPSVPDGWRTVLLDLPRPSRQKLDGANVKGGASKHYRPLSLNQILGMHVAEVLADNAQVWLWATYIHLHDAFHCLETWRLKYKTTLTG